jgi:hypothetical protein
VIPSLATIPNSLLIAISTPYRRAGLLYTKWKDHFGQDDDDVLVVHGSSRTFNPTISQAIVDDALQRDPAAAGAEWLGEFRDDIAAFLSRELIEAAVDRGVVVRPPEQGIDYHAFADPSGGLVLLKVGHRLFNVVFLVDFLLSGELPVEHHNSSNVQLALLRATLAKAANSDA